MQELTKLTDEQLVKAYVGGNNEAFDALLLRHQAKVYSYILHIVKNKDIADDIFQDTFVKIIMTLKQGRYTETGKFGAWLTRIAHNLIIDYCRQEKSENCVSTDDENTSLLNRRDLSEGTVEDELVACQISSDMSFKEIADATGVSINTALGRMRYAILNMRRIASDNNIVLTL